MTDHPPIPSDAIPARFFDEAGGLTADGLAALYAGYNPPVVNAWLGDRALLTRVVVEIVGGPMPDTFPSMVRAVVRALVEATGEDDASVRVITR